jgi:hypothetical protein
LRQLIGSSLRPPFVALLLKLSFPFQKKLCPAFMRLRDGRSELTTAQRQDGVAMPCFSNLVVRPKPHSQFDHRLRTARITTAMQTLKGQRDLTTASK